MSDFLEMFSDNPLWLNIIFIILTIFAVSFLAWLAWNILYSFYNWIGFIRAKIQYEKGVITNKYYHGSSSHTGVGITTNGQMAVTTSYEGEEYVIEYKSNDDGEKYRIDTDSDIYDSVDIGDKVKAYFQISRTTKEFRFTGGFEKIGD